MDQRSKLPKPESDPTEIRRDLVAFIKEKTKEIVSGNRVLEAVRGAELSQEQWREFAEQRYLAALLFEDLLKSGAKKAREAGDIELAETLEDNLRDEIGVDASGTSRPDLSHANWRRDFYGALGISETDLEKQTPLAGTNDYSRAMEGLIQKGDYLEISGALLTLEASIPVEFDMMKTGRDRSFGSLFVDAEDDTEETKALKARRRLYIDDHIKHDAASHYPDLLKALEKHITPDEVERVKRGAQGITDAKKKFYRSLEEKLMGVNH